MEQGLIDLRNKAKEYGKKHGMVSQFPTSCENMVALIDRIEQLEVTEKVARRMVEILREVAKAPTEKGRVQIAPLYFERLANVIENRLVGKA
jgi:hypothetical protein